MTETGGGGIRAAGASVVTRLAVGGPGQPLWLEVYRSNLVRPWEWVRGLGRWRRAVTRGEEPPLPLSAVAWLAQEVAPYASPLAFVRPLTGLAIGSWCFIAAPTADVLCGVELVATPGGIGLVGFAQPWFVPGDHFETLPYEEPVTSAGAGARVLAAATTDLVAAVARTYGTVERLLALPPVTAHDELALYLEDLELRAYGALWLGRETEARRRVEALATLRDRRWYTTDELNLVRLVRNRAADVREALTADPATARARLEAWRDRHRAAWT